MSAKSSINIDPIVRQKLCSGCGACFAVCPVHCITMTADDEELDYPHIDRSSCTGCQKCLQVCPGKHLLEGAFVKLQKTPDPVGPLLECKVGYARDTYIWRHSASGGFVTALLNSLLQKGEIAGAVCVKQSEAHPLDNRVFIATNSEELLQSLGSRYSPASPCVALRDLLRLPGKFALVGKPCDIEGVSRIQTQLPVFKEKITLKIGLFCHHTPFRKALKNILKQNNILVENIEKIQFRGNGWPGEFKILQKDNITEYSLPYFEAWQNYFSSFANIPLRCLLCDDCLAAYGDFSVGDPWDDEYIRKQEGRSVVVIRTHYAQELNGRLEADGDVRMIEISKADVGRFQKNLLAKKMDSLLWLTAYMILFEHSKLKWLITLGTSSNYNLGKKLSILKKLMVILEKIYF